MMSTTVLHWYGMLISSEINDTKMEFCIFINVLPYCVEF